MKATEMQKVVIIGSALETWTGTAMTIFDFVDRLLTGRLVQQLALGKLDMSPLKPDQSAADVLAQPAFSGRYAWYSTGWVFADGAMVIAGTRDVIISGEAQRQAQFVLVDKETSDLLPARPANRRP